MTKTCNESPARPTSGEVCDHVQAFEIAHTIMLIESGITPASRGRDLLNRSLSNSSMLSGSVYAPSPAEYQAVRFRLKTREQLLTMMETTYQLREALIRIADQQSHIVILTPNGAPTSLGHWALMIDSALTRDSERLVALYNRLNKSPAGAFAPSGSILRLNRLRMAELLGFAGLIENTYDALQSPDLAFEFGAELMIVAQSLARLIDDLLTWCQGGNKIITLGDVGNLAQLYHLRDIATQAFATLASLTMAERGATGQAGHARAGHHDALHNLADTLSQGELSLAAMLDQAHINEQIVLKLTQNNWTDLTDLIQLFIRENGLSLHHAQDLANDILNDAQARAVPCAAITAADVMRLAQAAGETEIAPSQAQLDDAFNPVAFVRRRETLGGAGTDAMTGGLMSAQARIRLGRSRLSDRQRALAAADSNRIHIATTLLEAQG